MDNVQCVEEEYSLAFATPWRKRDGWKPVLLYGRGPGAIPGLLSPFLSLAGIWRFNRVPRRLADCDAAAFRGAKVIATSTWLGSYGMGGPGFAGVRLRLPKGGSTWIVVTLWGAEGYLTLGGSVLAEAAAMSGRSQPALSSAARPLSDLRGARLDDMRLDRDAVELVFSSRVGAMPLLLSRDMSRLLPFANGKARTLGEETDLRDCVVVSRRGSLWLTG